MEISIFDLFRPGIGPSSSHTVGPMRAARLFSERLSSASQVEKLEVHLYGSLALTGKGHGIVNALLYGLMGERPETCDPVALAHDIALIGQQKILILGKKQKINFAPETQLVFHYKEVMPRHPNGMKFTALADGKEVAMECYSIGGGFIEVEGEFYNLKGQVQRPIPYPFSTGLELFNHCLNKHKSVSEVIAENEVGLFATREEFNQRLDFLWGEMFRCIERGMATQGILPGGLKVKRRAYQIHQNLLKQDAQKIKNDPLVIMDWVNLYALAVNEENAMGGKVVTAPTNGAAGIIPAVGLYYLNHVAGADPKKMRDYLLCAGAIGTLYKKNASISGAEVGCQGEVGVACSMAAAGLTEILGGTAAQVENAAEIGMEHNLGLTCDPIGGLVQIPCIERNAMGAIKAINASRLALAGDGTHQVSLDKVIKTMRQTGLDMKKKYKETSKGGLAVNVTEC
jgi:L-serine dehydratase